MENELPERSGHSSLVIDELNIVYLDEIRRWAYFLAIVGFVGIGFLILFGLFMGSFMGNYIPVRTAFPMKLVSAIYVLLALIYLFPVLYLYRFAINMKIALRESNQEKLQTALGSARSLFRFTGIITLIVISLYFVVFISAIVYSVVSRF